MADVDDMAGTPDHAPEWDGIAGPWFETAADDNAAYGRAVRPMRAKTQANTKAFQRLVVRESEQRL